MKRATYGWLGLIGVGIAIAIGIIFFSPFASGSPDGLERVAEDEGFIDKAEDSPYDIIPDYAMPGVEDEGAATVLAGIVGVLVVAAIGFALGYGPRLLRRSADDGDGTSGPLSSSKAGSGTTA